MTKRQDPNVDLRTVRPNNPRGAGGFGDHPENRNPGGWKSEDSISHQYKKIMRMTDEELEKFRAQPDKTQAQKIALVRIENAIKESGLNDTKEITDRTEGKAPQFFGLGDGDEFNKRTGATIVFEDRPDED